jgi:hypothetical protein
MRIFLRSLQLEAFRSIREALEFKFPERGMMLIRGKNLDTGGSSGAGKTNLFLGVSLALGYCPFPGTELQSWDTDEKYRVKLELGREDQDPLMVIRSPTGGSVGGEKMAKPAGAKLQAYLGGLDAEMLRLLTYAQQDDQQDFLSLDPKGKFDFLSQMFSEIAELEKVGEKASQAAAAAETQLQFLKPQMSQLTQRLMSAQAALTQAVGVEALRLEGDRLQDLVETLRSRKCLALEQRRQAEMAKERKITELRTQADAVQARNDGIRQAAVTKAQVLTNDARPHIQDLQKQITEAQTKVTEHQRRRIPNHTDVNLSADPRFQQLQEQHATADKHCNTLYLGYEKAKADATKQKFANALQQGQLRLKIQAIETAAKVLPKLTQELDLMQASKCPTCTQPWVNEQEIARRKAEVLTLSTNLLEVPALKAEDEALGKPIPEPQPPAQLARLQEIRAQISAAMSDMIGVEVARLQTEHQLEAQARSKHLSQVQGQLNALHQDLEQRRAKTLEVGQPTPEQFQEHQKLTQELQRVQLQPLPDFGLPQVEKELEHAQNQLTNNNRAVTDKMLREEAAQRELAQAQQGVTELMAKIGALETELKLESDIGEVLSRTGFLSALFTEILDEIGLETNKILQQVANTAEVSLRFVSEQENKSGKVVRGIRALATIRGHEAPLRSGASGGMNTAIRLAVRFAVRAVASRRTGVYPAWVCLDEPFNGLGPVEKETCMEILKIIAERDLVMVVDHGSEFQALFDQEIVLVLDKGITRVA